MEDIDVPPAPLRRVRREQHWTFDLVQEPRGASLHSRLCALSRRRLHLGPPGSLAHPTAARALRSHCRCLGDARKVHPPNQLLPVCSTAPGCLQLFGGLELPRQREGDQAPEDITHNQAVPAHGHWAYCAAALCAQALQLLLGPGAISYQLSV